MVLNPFYVIKTGDRSFQVIDYLSKLAICKVYMEDVEAAERWANRIAKAMNESMPTKR
jgi:hypothetical protein